MTLGRMAAGKPVKPGVGLTRIGARFYSLPDNQRGGREA